MVPTTGNGPRFRKRELFRILRYEPHAGQLLVHRSTARRRVLACGSRWGKSMCASMEACAALLEPCDRRLGWLVAPTRDLVDRIFMRVVDTLKTHFPLRVLELDLRIQRIVVSNLGGGRSELRGKSADVPVTLLGEAVDFLIIDEAARLRGEIWEGYLSQRLVDRGGWVLFLSTPAGGGWFHKLFRSGQRNRDPACQSWTSPSWANPHLDPAIIEAEKSRLPEEAFRQEYGAEFLGAEPEPCETCDWPDAEAEWFVLLYEGESLGECPECGRTVGPDGKVVADSRMVGECKGSRPRGPQWAWGRAVDEYGHPLKRRSDATPKA